jgi:hypothetical protein
MKLSQDQINNISVKIKSGNDRDIVLIETSGRRDLSEHDHNANIYCIDTDFHVIWQIDAAHAASENDAFIYLKRVGTRLRADRFSGFEYTIDEKTGIAKQVDWHK